jgi:hypothetical protein
MPCNEDNVKLGSAPLAGRKQRATLEGYRAAKLPRTKSADRARYAFLQQFSKGECGKRIKLHQNIARKELPVSLPDVM